MVTTETLTFAGSLGATLDARLDLPDGAPKAYALFAHCFTCTKEFHPSRRISAALAALGIAVLRFDFTGLGGSEGDFAETNFTTNVNDLLCAANFLEDRGQAPQLIIGHSLGGTAALVASQQLPYVNGVVTINSPCHPSHVAKRFIPVKDEVLWRGEADALVGGRTFTLKQHFFDALEPYDMDHILSTLNKALLVLHAPYDETVSVKNASYIFSTARHPKSFISLDDADHLVKTSEDARYIAAVIAAWATRYLD